LNSETFLNVPETAEREPAGKAVKKRWPQLWLILC